MCCDGDCAGPCRICGRPRENNTYGTLCEDCWAQGQPHRDQTCTLTDHGRKPAGRTYSGHSHGRVATRDIDDLLRRLSE